MIFGVVTAFLIVGFSIIYYGPTGRYFANSVVIEPNVLAQLNYNDYNPETGGSDRYVFDEITFEKGDEILKMGIDLTTYAKFYELIKDDKSLSPLSPVKEAFNSNKLAILKIFVRTESPAAWQKNVKIFQEMEFDSQGNYYRVQLHESEKGIHWVYFHHPEILSKILHIFKP